MSYPEGSDDISTILENNRLEQEDVRYADVLTQSLQKNGKLSADVFYTLPLNKDGEKSVPHKRLYSTIKKMNSVEEDDEAEAEEDDGVSKTYGNKPDDESSVSKTPNIRLHHPTPYTSSPHPQRHSRWTSRFLTHPGHWRPSSNTPAIPLPLPYPRTSNTRTNSERADRERPKTALDVSPSQPKISSAKSRNKFDEWEKQPVSSTWTMDLPPMSSLYDSIFPDRQENRDGKEDISWPVTSATSTKSNSGAYGSNRLFSSPYYLDTYFTDNGYSNGLAAKQDIPNVASKAYVVKNGDTSSIDAKKLLITGKEDSKQTNNNEKIYLDTGILIPSPEDTPLSSKSTSSLSSSWMAPTSVRAKSNLNSDNDIWLDNQYANIASNADLSSAKSSYSHFESNHRCKNNHASFNDVLHNKMKVDLGYETRTRTLKEDDSALAESDLSFYNSDGNKLEINTLDDGVVSDEVPVYHSPQNISKNASSNSQPNLSASKAFSENKVTSERLYSPRSSLEDNASSLELNHQLEGSKHAVKYNDEISASMHPNRFLSSLPYSSVSSLNFSNKVRNAQVLKSDTIENLSKLEIRLSNEKQNKEALRSPRMEHEFRQNRVATTKIHQNKIVQKESVLINSTKKKKNSANIDTYYGSGNVMNNNNLEMEMHSYNNGPRTSALKSDIKKNSSRAENGDRIHRIRTTLSDSLATPIPSTPMFNTAEERRPNNSGIQIPNEYRLRMGWSREQEEQIEMFYKGYDIMDGAVTAVVLGGFFAFVCLLVLYKTKVKPMWKNRGKRLTTTPATASVAEPPNLSGVGGSLGGMESITQGENIFKGSPCRLPLDGKEHDYSGGNNHPCVQDCVDDCENCVGEQEEEEEDEVFDGFECIPLQTVNYSEENDDDDIFFLDEFGNYVFPISTTASIAGGRAVSDNAFMGTSTNCSCQLSAEELDKDLSRRVSQVSFTYVVSKYFDVWTEKKLFRIF